MADENGQSQNEKILEEIDSRFRDEVNQANELLEWAVAVGWKFKSADLVQQIKKGQELLAAPEISVSDKAAFESSYNELTKAISPVTWETMRATSLRHGKRTWLAIFKAMKGGKISVATAWSRILWIWTVLLLLFILVGENLQEYLDTFAPVDSESVETQQLFDWSRLTFWFSKIIPFLYGALGACAFLLRSCHKFIHARTFDPTKIPEYYNRILLGFLAGGTILLFIDPESAPQKVGATALAFLAGYSTDFLFTTLERTAGALLPKKVAETGTKPEAKPGG